MPRILPPPRSTPPATRGRPRLAGLDGIRAVAIALVLGVHLDAPALPGGQIGVDVFFGLSGFLITGLLLKEWDETGRVRLRFFYARRALRLIPALVFAVAGALAVGLWLGYPHPWLDSISALTYTSNLYFGVVTPHRNAIDYSWSLAVEEQFYLLWPLLLVFVLRRGRSAVWPAVWIGLGCLVATALLRPTARVDLLYQLPITRAPDLMLGALAAFWLRRGPGVVARRVLSSAAVPVVAAVVVAVLLTLPMYGWPWAYRGGYALAALAGVAVALHAVLAPESWVSRLLAWRPVSWLGRRSYALYLWQVPAIIVVAHLGLSLVFAVLLSLVLAEASWWLVEQPALRRKRRFEVTHIGADAPVGEPIRSAAVAEAVAG